MRAFVTSLVAVALAGFATTAAHAVVLIGGSTNNGNMDRTHADLIVDNDPAGPGPEDFFLPKPDVWVYEGSRAITGPYADGLASEPWAGPAPTPVTTDGNLNPPHPEGCGGPDCGVFFKAFSGGPNDGPATASLHQDHPATPGLIYTLSGWAGAEANYLSAASLLSLDFLDAGNNAIGGAVIDMNPLLTVPNGQPFNYKQYSVSAVAPAGAVTVRAAVAMIDGVPNPLGGGQAFVVDDFTLTAIPEPTSVAIGLIGVLGLLGLIRRR